MSPALTRRGLVQAAGAAIGAVAGGVPVPVLAVPAPHPDAALLDLVARYAAADAAYDRAAAEEERTRALAFAAHPPRPEALRRRPDDFPGTGLGAGLSDTDEDGARRWYGRRGVDWMRDRPAATWFPGQGGPLGPNDETRRLEILSAWDRWWAGRWAVDASSGWDAASEAENDAADELDAIGREILSTAPTTPVGLAAKARWASRPELNDITAGIWSRQIVADAVAMAERGALGGAA